MHLQLYTTRLLNLAETLHRWMTILATLDQTRRLRVADYADAIAATLARATSALVQLEAAPASAAARYAALRELGRIAGYVETIVAGLEHHLDGRKLAGVKRRLEQLDIGRLAERIVSDPPARDESSQAGPREPALRPQVDKLLAAEGYFRALSDGLRT
jgi:hypothetical protein